MLVRADQGDVYFIADSDFSLQVNLASGTPEELSEQAYVDAKMVADRLLACASPLASQHEEVASLQNKPQRPKKRATLPAGVQSAAIFPLRSLSEADQRVADVLYTLLPETIQKSSPALKVVAASDLDAMVGLDRMKDAMGCDNVNCAAQMAGAMGVDSIIYGSVNRLGSKYLLSLTWIDAKKGTILSRHTQQLGSQIEAFDSQVAQGAEALLAGTAAGE